MGGWHSDRAARTRPWARSRSGEGVGHPGVQADAGAVQEHRHEVVVADGGHEVEHLLFAETLAQLVPGPGSMVDRSCSWSAAEMSVDRTTIATLKRVARDGAIAALETSMMRFLLHALSHRRRRSA